MMAMQAISQYSVIFAGSTPSGNIVVTAIDPPMSPTSVDITAENSDILQIVQVKNASGFLFYFLHTIGLGKLQSLSHMNCK